MTAHDFERIPPQDMQAEMSTLGGMLLSKDAIAEVSGILQAGDYYRPAHGVVHTAVLDLWSRSEPVDPITVAAELTKRGQITKVGGQGYLFTLVHAVPTAANAGYYAEIVREKAVLRRLVEAGTRVAQIGYSGAMTAAEALDAAAPGPAPTLPVRHVEPVRVRGGIRRVERDRGGDVVSRIRSFGCMTRVWAGASDSAIRSSRSSTAIAPASAIGRSTVVSAGVE